MLYVSSRSDSRQHQFRMRTPRSILPQARGRRVFIAFPGTHQAPALTISAKIGETIKFSLGTRDDALARERKTSAQATLERFFSAIEDGPRPLTHRETVALSGSVYRLYVDMHGDNPGPPEGWAAFKALNRAAAEGRIISAPPLSLPPPQRHAGDRQA